MVKSPSVLDFDVSYSGASLIGTNIGTGIHIAGTPYHVESKQLIDRYRESTSDFLSFEARHSCGNYSLIDTSEDGVTVITSPGFCGGYFVTVDDELHVTATLSQALAHVERSKLNIDPDRLVHLLSNDIKTRLPISTIFDNIYRLPPGVHFEGNGSGWNMEVNFSIDHSSPSFEETCEEICDGLSDQDVTLCLSGGADSAALAGIMVENDVEFETVIFDRGPGLDDAVERGAIIADEFGIDYNVTEVRHPLSSDAASHVEKRLRQDIVKPYTPTHQINASDNDMFLYGFYPDVLCWPKMQDQYSYKKMSQEPPRRILGKFLRFLPNIQYTAQYIENSTFRELYLNTIPALVHYMNPIISYYMGKTFPPEPYNVGIYHDNPEFDLSADEYDLLRGLLTTGRVSVINDRQTFDPLAPGDETTVTESYSSPHIERELSLMNEIGSFSSGIKMVKEFTYMINMQNTNKQISTFYTPSRNHVEIPMCWGPAVSHFFSNTNTFNRAMYPKPEVYEVVRENTGVPYVELMQDVSDKPNNHSDSPKDQLITNQQQYLTPAESMVLKHIDDDNLEQIKPLYNWANSKVTQAEGMTLREYGQIMPLLNIELILDEVYCQSD